MAMLQATSVQGHDRQKSSTAYGRTHGLDEHIQRAIAQTNINFQEEMKYFGYAYHLDQALHASSYHHHHA